MTATARAAAAQRKALQPTALAHGGFYSTPLLGKGPPGVRVQNGIDFCKPRNGEVINSER